MFTVRGESLTVFCCFGHVKLYVVPALGKVTLEKEISDLSGALSHPWF